MTALESRLKHLGFVPSVNQYPTLNHWELTSTGGITVLVQVWPTGRYEVFIEIRTKMFQTLSRPIHQLKDLTDLEDFISYL